jgi:hypothetical protein
VIETIAVSDTQHTSFRHRAKQEEASVGEVIDFVKAYAKQETIGPLAGAGRWLAYGAAAAVSLSIGLVFVLLGLLRLLQTEFQDLTGRSSSPGAYAIVLVVTLLLLYVVISRIKKSTLNNEPK